MSSNPPAVSETDRLAASVRLHYDADILCYFGPVDRPKDDALIDLCGEKKRKNVLLMICTFGGDPHAAYRIARTLQKRYAPGEVLAYVSSSCWSAGTLIVIGADRLILSEHGEMGPIDVQLRRHDEVGEYASTLTPLQAMQYLGEESQRVFAHQFQKMRAAGFPTKLASTVAAELTTGLIGKLYEQVDPMRVAEINRALGITAAYGNRIARNLKTGALTKLLRSYPSHDFVIDPTEARDLFERVEEPNENLEALGEILKEEAQKHLHGKTAYMCYLEEPPASEPVVESAVTNEQSAHENAPKDANGTSAPAPTDVPTNGRVVSAN